MKCVIRRFKDLLVLPTQTTLVIEAAYCSAGLHETKLVVASESDKEELKDRPIPDDKVFV